MAKLLTDANIKKLETPKAGNAITYDKDVKGFGVRVTAAGSRAFVLNYRTRSGRERRYTIGSCDNWKATAARKEAKRLKALVDLGQDPVGDVKAERSAETVAELCERFKKEYLPRKRPSTEQDYKSMIDRTIVPALGSLKVREVTYSDCDGLHRKISSGKHANARKKAGSPYRANRVLAVLSKVFSQAVKWQYRTDNPVKGVERNTEHKRERYYTSDELKRLVAALDKHEDQVAANIFRLCMLTGARVGEVRAAKWEDFDLTQGVWTKPGATTKQQTTHRAPLSAAALQLVKRLRDEAEKAARKGKQDVPEYIFPARYSGVPHREETKDAWDEVRKAAKLTNARTHDLRHTYASILASAGQGLPIIGRLLGHTQVATTARYAHLFDDPLRKATETAGAILTGQPSAEVVDIQEARK
jgi:integrase